MNTALKLLLRLPFIVCLSLCLFGCGGGDDDDDESSSGTNAMPHVSAEVMDMSDAESDSRTEDMESMEAAMDQDTQSGQDSQDDSTRNMQEQATQEQQQETEPAPPQGGNTILVVSDSIGAGTGAGDPFPNRIARLTGRPVSNRSIAGATSGALAGRIGGIVSGSDASTILVLIGTNDAISGNPGGTGGNINTILSATRATGARTIVGTIPPAVGPQADKAGRVAQVNGAIRSAASANGVAVADVFGAFGNNPAFLNADGFHPNDAGHSVIASAFANQL